MENSSIQYMVELIFMTT